MSNKVAVYGTLKAGFRANGMLSSAIPLGGGQTKQKYMMTDVGFPMIKRDDEGHNVEVEVYEKPEWEVLDMYEGVPSLYERHIIEVELSTGELVDAYIYEATDISGEAVAPRDGILNWGRYNG